MANINLTPALVNALAVVHALSAQEQSDLMQMLVALGRGSSNVVSAPTQVAPTPAPAPTQTAKQSRELSDTTVYVDLSFDGKGVEFYVLSANGARKSAFTFMQGIKALVKDVVLEWDKTLVSKDTYHSDANGNVYGDHKHGAYKLLDGKGKALTKAKVAEWVKAHADGFVLTAEGKAEYFASKDAKKAKTAERDAKILAKYGYTLPNA